MDSSRLKCASFNFACESLSSLDYVKKILSPEQSTLRGSKSPGLNFQKNPKILLIISGPLGAKCIQSCCCYFCRVLTKFTIFLLFHLNVSVLRVSVGLVHRTSATSNITAYNIILVNCRYARIISVFFDQSYL